MTRAGTIPLSDIASIQLYTKKKRNNKSGMKAILDATGGDIVMNGPIFLRDLQACCHLKADGDVLCAPHYTAWGISWTKPTDFCVEQVPNMDENYAECVHLIVNGVSVASLNYGADMGGRRPRTAVGTQDGCFAYYASSNGQTPESLRNTLYETGWENAIMMDGGGSTCIYFRDGTGFAGDGRTIPFWIVVTLKKNEADCPYSEPTANIKKWSIGTGAKWVQWHLNLHGAGLTVDGIFGNNSVFALKLFQQNNGLKADGICGPATREALKH